MSHSLVPHLLAWARCQQRPVTFFQLATTAQVPHVVWFGIADLGTITLLPNGRIETRSVFINPDCRISSETAQRLGICETNVAHQPSWAAWAPIFHLMAQEHVMVSFDLNTFGREVIQMQNERYGVAGTSFLHALDARALPGVVGTLTQAVAGLGLKLEAPRRALDAVWLTAILVEALAARHGLDVLDACVGLSPSYAPPTACLRDSAHADAPM